MNVLLIFEFAFPPYRNFLVKEISKLSSRLSIVTGDDRFDSCSSVVVSVLPRLVAFGDNIVYFLAPFRVLRADVIFTTFNLRRPHTWIYAFFLPYKKWIFWGQGRWGSEFFLVRILRIILLKISSGYIVYTPEGKSNLIAYGYPSSKITVAYNTIEVPNAGLTIGSKYFLYVGRLQDRKKIDLAILSLKGTSFRLRIVGDGLLRSYLSRLVFENNLEEQIDFFPGTFDEGLLKWHFSNAIAYVSPGHVGLGVVHAFAYGVPVITISSFVHGPEFSYCSEANSYLCCDPCELMYLLKNFDSRSVTHLSKCRSAFSFFDLNLRPGRMLASFARYL